MDCSILVAQMPLSPPGPEFWGGEEQHVHPAVAVAVSGSGGPGRRHLRPGADWTTWKSAGAWPRTTGRRGPCLDCLDCLGPSGLPGTPSDGEGAMRSRPSPLVGSSVRGNSYTEEGQKYHPVCAVKLTDVLATGITTQPRCASAS